MDRTVPFNEDERCDNCHNFGVWDFMGDYLCQECIDKANKRISKQIKSEKTLSE